MLDTLTEAERFFYEHAGYGYDPNNETIEQGHIKCARQLAETEAKLHAEPELFVVWEVDDIDSSSFEETDEPRPLYCAMLCRDAERDAAEIVRGYSQRDGIFERPGVVVQALGGIDLGDEPGSDPYKRVVVAELMLDFESQRESMVQRGEN